RPDEANRLPVVQREAESLENAVRAVKERDVVESRDQHYSASVAITGEGRRTRALCVNSTIGNTVDRSPIKAGAAHTRSPRRLRGGGVRGSCRVPNAPKWVTRRTCVSGRGSSSASDARQRVAAQSDLRHRWYTAAAPDATPATDLSGEQA